MPYKQVWFDAPKNESLKVHADLPDGYHERDWGFRGYREAELEISHWSITADMMMYLCEHCGGWIAGEPNRYHVDTLRSMQLAGRKGEEFYCLRCGRRIGFVGLMS